MARYTGEWCPNYLAEVIVGIVLPLQITKYGWQQSDRTFTYDHNFTLILMTAMTKEVFSVSIIVLTER